MMAYLRWLRTHSIILALVFLYLSFPVVAQSSGGTRYALVIGNAAYGEMGTLKNPINDARDMAASLGRLGFSVDLLTDAELSTMENAVVKLSQRLSGNPDAIGLFYYAGHGLQADGVNYLIPVRTSIPEAAFLKSKALSAQSVLDLMQNASNKLNLVFLDACRDYPSSWSRGSTRGLAVVGNQPPGSVIVYATSAGSTAQDGNGRNGVFTGQLLKNIETEGLDLNTLLDRTALGVLSETNNRQNPAIYKQFFGTVVLKGSALASPVSVKSQPAPATPSFGAISVTPGSLSVTLATAGTVDLLGMTTQMSAGGTLPVNNVAPGSCPITVSYADGKTESQTITIESGKTSEVSFSYRPMPKPPAGMVFIQGGTFSMGSSDRDQKPAHQVTVSSFNMSAKEVTQAEYEAVMGINPSKFKGAPLPVEHVSWFDAINYCNARSVKEGLSPVYTWSGSILSYAKNGTIVTWNRDANGYRLPTEAEWEYAARGGKEGQGYIYAGSVSLDDIGWFKENSGKTTHPAGLKQPNELGLYDMSGNVWEWCWDWYGKYAAGNQTDPSGPSLEIGANSFRVRRGGSFLSTIDCAVTFRYPVAPWLSYTEMGFRVVRNP